MHDQITEKRGYTLTHDRLVRPEKAAAIADLSRATVYRLMQDGSLPSVLIRGARRIRVSDVLALGE